MDQQIGLVARVGRQHGLEMSLTTRLVDMIHELEDGRRQMSWNNVEELDRVRLPRSAVIQSEAR